MTENIYPIIKSAEETQELVNKTINPMRVKEMLLQRDILNKDLKRYQKLNKRWKKVDKSIKISATIFIGLTSIATAISSPLVKPLVYPWIPIVLGIVSGTESILLGGTVFGLTNKKKKFYLDKCKHIQSYLDKMYLYIEKCKEDGIITLEEIEGFRKLIEEYKLGLENLKTSEIDIEKLRKEVDKEVKKNLKKELIQEQKENLKSQFHSRLN